MFRWGKAADNASPPKMPARRRCQNLPTRQQDDGQLDQELQQGGCAADGHPQADLAGPS